MDSVLHYWPILSTIITGLLAWFVWSIKRGLATKEDLESLRHDVDGELTKTRAESCEIEGRLARMEAQLAPVPDLGRQIGEIHGDVREMAGEMRAVAEQIRMLFQHHLEH